MRRSDKQALVEKIVNLYNANEYVFMVNYKGICADDAYGMRKAISMKTGDKVLVVKNSLHRVALQKLNLSDSISEDIFTDQVALIFTNNILGIASLLKKYIDKKIITFIGYFDKKKLYTYESFVAVSVYENVQSLRSSLLGTLVNSYSGIVRLLNVKSSN